jgi:SAM-dependent methyltransferase
MADHPRYAAFYERSMAGAEEAGLGAQRAQLLARARGRVLEIGGGTGLNLRHYRAATSVTVLEPDGAMRERLETRRLDCPCPMTLLPMGVEEADFPPASFDTVVCTLVLCTVPDPDAALGRLRGWLAPEGSLLFIEHTAAPGGWGLVQALLDPLWHRLIPGCHLHRDPMAAMRRVGFMVRDYDRLDLTMIPGLIDNLVVGVACEGLVEPPVPSGTYPRPHRRRPRRAGTTKTTDPAVGSDTTTATPGSTPATGTGTVQL